MILRSVFLSALVIAVVVAGPVRAQTAQPGTPAISEDQPGRQVERRITDLKTRLQITPAQEPQWAAFASAMRQNAAHMSQLSAGRATQAGTQKAPDEMRGYAEVARAHAEDLGRLIGPFDALYAIMPAGQQAIADRAFNRPAGRSRRH